MILNFLQTHIFFFIDNSCSNSTKKEKRKANMNDYLADKITQFSTVKSNLQFTDVMLTVFPHSFLSFFMSSACLPLTKTGMVFCYQNCSDLLWEKIVLVIEKNFCKIFEITRTIYSSSERSEQFLVT